MQDLSIRPLLAADIHPISAAFAELGWNKPVSKYKSYLAEQESGRRVVLVAELQAVFAGYLTVCWYSHYPPFLEAGIPEIVDLNVLPHFRRAGIGTRLMDVAESRISTVSPLAGIGVGMSVDYGAAQRMYVLRGYVPDACGLMYGGQPVTYYQKYMVDDDLCLYLTKQLPPAGVG